VKSDKIGKIGVGGEIGSEVEIGKKVGEIKFGDGEKSGMGKCTGGHETLAILVTLYNIL